MASTAVLADLARRHEVDTRAFVTRFFPKVAVLSGFDCKSRVVAELQAAIVESQQNKLGYVLLLAGTYLGAKGATLHSRTDQILMAFLGGGHVPRAYIDLFTMSVDVIKKFQLAGGQGMFASVTEELKAAIEWRNLVTLHARMVEAAIGLIEAAGLRAIVAELSPSVTTCVSSHV